MTLPDLIAALERAEGPSRELDLRIARDVLNSEPLGHAAGMSDDLLLVQAEWGPWPRYTASLDAALSLVPEGLHWLVDGKNWACVVDVNGVCNQQADAATPAIALCIASLKARSATNGD